MIEAWNSVTNKSTRASSSRRQKGKLFHAICGSWVLTWVAFYTFFRFVRAAVGRQKAWKLKGSIKRHQKAAFFLSFFFLLLHNSARLMNLYFSASVQDRMKENGIFMLVFTWSMRMTTFPVLRVTSWLVFMSLCECVCVCESAFTWMSEIVIIGKWMNNKIIFPLSPPDPAFILLPTPTPPSTKSHELWHDPQILSPCSHIENFFFFFFLFLVALHAQLIRKINFIV